MPRFTSLWQAMEPFRPYVFTVACPRPLVWHVAYKRHAVTLRVRGTRTEAEAIAQAYFDLFLSEQASPQYRAYSEAAKLDLAEMVAASARLAS